MMFTPHPPLGTGPWTHSDWIGLGTWAAVLIALWISYRDRRTTDARISAERAADRADFVRRREYDQLIRLLTLTEEDKQKVATNPGSTPRSPEATALLHTLAARTCGLGRAYYHTPEKSEGWLREVGIGTPKIFDHIQAEITDALEKLDYAERNHPHPRKSGLRGFFARLRRAAKAVRHAMKSNPN